jgi:hypothetical protein
MCRAEEVDIGLNLIQSDMEVIQRKAEASGNSGRGLRL